MRLREFVDRLSASHWRLEHGQFITSADDHCPLHEVHADLCEGICDDFHAAGDRLGLPESLIQAIAGAADNTIYGYGARENIDQLRGILLERCGLAPTTEAM